MITKIYDQQEFDAKRAEIISQGIRPMRDTSFTEKLNINGNCSITIQDENDEIIEHEDFSNISSFSIDYGKVIERVNILCRYISSGISGSGTSTHWDFPNNSKMIIQTDNEILMVLHRRQISETIVEFKLESLGVTNGNE